MPFTTAWLGDTEGASIPTAIYGISLILPAFAYLILQTLLIRADEPDSALAKAVASDNDWKGKFSPVFYALGIVTAFFMPPLSWALYVLVALIWLVPDKRVERVIGQRR